MRQNTVSTLVLLFAFSSGLLAEEQKPGPDSTAVKLKPVILDLKDGSGAAVGLEYALNGDVLKKDLLGGDAGSSDFNPKAPVGFWVVSYNGSGTIAGDKNKNPKNFMDLLVDGKFLYSPTVGSFAGGFFTKFETDQGFDNKQFVYGLRLTTAKYISGSNSSVAIDANYGRVDPNDDTDRKTAIGDGKLEAYYRLDLEFLYMQPIDLAMLKTVELNYRYFQEISPSSAIKDAKLDKHNLLTFRIGLPNDMFAAYSSGKLPFDKKKDQIYELGFSYKFE